MALSSGVWESNSNLDFILSVSEKTGELINRRKEAKYKSLHFVLSPSLSGSLSCSLYGSLHKHNRINELNNDDFLFSELHETLNDLNASFGIILDNTLLHSLEIGVNIRLPYSPRNVFKSVICHKGKPFNSLDKQDKKLGLICEHTDYAIKLYDKGYQSNSQESNILRYELKLKRQRMLEPFNIRTLTDLQNVEKVASLLLLVVGKLNEIVFFNFSFKPNKLTTIQKLNWERYSNPKYWEGLNKSEYYKSRKRFFELSQKYGTLEPSSEIIEIVITKWFELLLKKHKKGLLFPQLLKDQIILIIETLRSTFKVTFSKLEYVLEKVTNAPDIKKENINTILQEKNYCISCGREITNQRRGSKFCSEKLYGKEAKRCRNKDSNKRRSEKRKAVSIPQSSIKEKNKFAGNKKNSP